jgi:hypothetical protein
MSDAPQNLNPGRKNREGIARLHAIVTITFILLNRLIRLVCAKGSKASSNDRISLSSFDA